MPTPYTLQPETTSSVRTWRELNSIIMYNIGTIECAGCLVIVWRTLIINQYYSLKNTTSTQPFFLKHANNNPSYHVA